MHVVCQFLQMFPRIRKGGAGSVMMLEVQLKECMCYHAAITQILFSLSLPLFPQGIAMSCSMTQITKLISNPTNGLVPLSGLMVTQFW